MIKDSPNIDEEKKCQVKVEFTPKFNSSSGSSKLKEKVQVSNRALIKA